MPAGAKAGSSFHAHHGGAAVPRSAPAMLRGASVALRDASASLAVSVLLRRVSAAPRATTDRASSKSLSADSGDIPTVLRDTADPLIICKDVSFSYGSRAAASGLNFTVHPGDYLCIVGPNGSGKSTLIRGLLRLMSPSAGSLCFSRDLKPSQVGYLPQQLAVSRDFPVSAYEVVLSGRLGRRGFRPFYSRADRSAATDWLARLQAGEFAHRNFGELSGGQQQRILLARALCAAERLLVLDEPAASLDLTLQVELEQIIAHLNREAGVTVVMVSHDLQSALEHTSLILHLDTTQRFFGTPTRYRASGVGDGFIGCFHEGSRSHEGGRIRKESVPHREHPHV